MLTLAGERDWIPMSINIVTPATLKAHWETYAASSAQAGRTADRAIWRVARDIYIGETPEQARRDVLDGVMGRDWREYFLPLLKKNNMLIGPKLDPTMPDDAVTLDYLCENLWIVGDVAEVTQKLRDLYTTRRRLRHTAGDGPRVAAGRQMAALDGVADDRSRAADGGPGGGNRDRVERLSHSLRGIGESSAILVAVGRGKVKRAQRRWTSSQAAIPDGAKACPDFPQYHPHPSDR